MRWMLILLLATSFPAIAQVYKWTDENGNVHFGSQPPPGQQEEVKIRQSAPGAMDNDQKKTYTNSIDKTAPSEQDPLLDSREKGQAAIRDLQCRSARKRLADAKRVAALKESLSGNVNEASELRMARYDVDLYCDQDTEKGKANTSMSPDYACQGARDRVQNWEERWDIVKRQGYTVSDEEYYEQRIREAERYRDNICR